MQPFYLIFGITTTGGGGGQIILLGHPLSFDSSTESKIWKWIDKDKNH